MLEVSPALHRVPCGSRSWAHAREAVTQPHSAIPKAGRPSRLPPAPLFGRLWTRLVCLPGFEPGRSHWQRPQRVADTTGGCPAPNRFVRLQMATWVDPAGGQDVAPYRASPFGKRGKPGHSVPIHAPQTMHRSVGRQPHRLVRMGTGGRYWGRSANDWYETSGPRSQRPVRRST